MQIAHLLAVIDAYAAHEGLPDSTVSSRVFRDTKKVAAMRDGADITVGRYRYALGWLSENWPDGAKWPKGVDRPAAKVSAE